MRHDNIVDLATVIQNAMIKYQDENPDNVDEHKIRQYALKEAMKFTKGKSNPEVIMHLIALEKSVYDDRRIALSGFLEC